MESILCLLHTESNGALARPALEALTAAKTLAADLGDAMVDVGLIGADVQAAADVIAPCGARRFLGAAGPELGEPRYATDAAAAEALIRASGATLVVAPQTSRVARVAGGVARRLGGSADTHITGLQVEKGALKIARWYYRQRMEATLSRLKRPWILVVDSGCVKPWEGAPGKARVEPVSVELTEAARRSRFLGVQEPPADEQTIRPEAELLFVAGAGWTKKQADGHTHVPDAEKLILEFLKRTQASLGGSKSLVDISGEGQAVLHFMTHLNQIGQTGATPRHPKGLATCCHGEEPHTVGWRFVNERRAVNRDPSCGWARGKADVLYVADAFEVMEKVNALLAKQD
ncbi:MAG: electron transfer flavoprotein subunit alpha [Vicinamibacteria bacterium]|nr:electron transfer flavoprotein subunit alpha [Vicinamibacteria bacterium]